MKVILIIALIGIATSTTTCEGAKISDSNRVNAYDTQYCRTLSLEHEEDADDATKKLQYYRCCYIVGKTVNDTKARGCVPLTYWQYGRVDDLADNATSLTKDNFKLSDVDIHCNSKYLTAITLLIPLVFVFF